MLTGLPSLEAASPPSLPESGFRAPLSAASLAGDLLRFFVRLLGCGAPAAVVLPHSSNICTNAILGLPLVQSRTCGTLRVLFRLPELEPLAYHRFLN